MASQDAWHIAGFKPLQNRQIPPPNPPIYCLLCPYLLPLLQGCDQPEFRYSPKRRLLFPTQRSGLQRTSSKRAEALSEYVIVVSVCFHARLKHISYIRLKAYWIILAIVGWCSLITKTAAAAQRGCWSILTTCLHWPFPYHGMPGMFFKAPARSEGRSAKGWAKQGGLGWLPWTRAGHKALSPSMLFGEPVNVIFAREVCTIKREA